MPFFDKLDIQAAQDAIVNWVEKYPEPAQELSEIWNIHLMKAGHKSMGRVIVSIIKEK